MTIHRAYGHVDRTAIRDGDPLRVVMASEGKQADGIDLRMDGADLGRFRANSVLGYGHAYYGRTNLPIGRVIPETIAVDGTSLAGELEFDAGDEFAREVERKMRAGYLSAVSIGFEVTQWESADDNYWRGGVATKWELSELSVVPIGMDANALVTAGRSLGDPAILAALTSQEFDELVRRLRTIADIGRPVEPIEPPTPPASGVPQDAARTFFAAFDSEESHV
jgi:HK97 family phage prohead protease